MGSLKLSACGRPLSGGAADSKHLMWVSIDGALPRGICKEMRGKRYLSGHFTSCRGFPVPKRAGRNPDEAFEPQSRGYNYMTPD